MCPPSPWRWPRPSGISSSVSGQGKPTAPVNSPTAGDYATADIRIITPGVVFSSGLDVVSAGSRSRPASRSASHGRHGHHRRGNRKGTPPPDIIFLPFQLMTRWRSTEASWRGTMMPFGRHPMGSPCRAGAPKPDISTVEKFAAAIKGAKAVMRSNPASRTMVATLIDDVLKRPEFAGVNAPASTNGEGGQALAAAKEIWRFRRSARFCLTRRSSSSVRCRKSWGVDRHDGGGRREGHASRRCEGAHPVSAAARVEQGVEAKGLLRLE